MTRSITKDNLKKILRTVFAAVFWIAVWQFAYVKVAQELLLVSPAQAFIRLIIRAREQLFWSSVAGTCLRVVAGFLSALVTGSALAALTARYKTIHAIVSPLLGVIRATPVASFIILVMLWLKTDKMPLFIAFLMVIPLIWANIYEGIAATDKSLLEMAKLFRMSRSKIFSAIYAPSLMPYFVSACSSGLGIAWKSAIATEVICLPKAAIGKQIYNARIYIETADLFAWTIAVIILSLLIEKLTLRGLKALGKRLSSPRKKELSDG